MNCLIGLLFPKGYKQRAKELLAQGVVLKTSAGDKSSDELKQERRRLLPSVQVYYFII